MDTFVSLSFLPHSSLLLPVKWFHAQLWITLSEKYIQSKQINWQGKIESCFSDRANPDDESLGEQIIKVSWTIELISFSWPEQIKLTKSLHLLPFFLYLTYLSPD